MTTIDNTAIIEVAIIEAFSVSEEVAQAIRYVLENSFDVDFDDVIETAQAEAREEDEAQIGESADTLTLDERLESKVNEALESAITDYELGENEGQKGSLYSLKDAFSKNGPEFQFGEQDDLIAEAEADVDNMIDEGVVDLATIADSWSRGQSRKEWVEQAVSIDGWAHTLARYDGSSDEFQTKDGDTHKWWAVYRTN